MYLADNILIESKGAVSAEVVQSMAEGDILANTDLRGYPELPASGGSSESQLALDRISCKNRDMPNRYQFRGTIK
jgi:hypothetical protein